MNNEHAPTDSVESFEHLNEALDKGLAKVNGELYVKFGEHGLELIDGQ